MIQAAGLISDPGKSAVLEENWNLLETKVPAAAYKGKVLDSDDTYATLAAQGNYEPGNEANSIILQINPGITDSKNENPKNIIYYPYFSNADGSVSSAQIWDPAKELATNTDTSKYHFDKLNEIESKIYSEYEFLAKDSEFYTIETSIDLIKDTIKSDSGINTTAFGEYEIFEIEPKIASYQISSIFSKMENEGAFTDMQIGDAVILIEAAKTQITSLGWSPVDITVKTYSEDFEEIRGLRMYRATDASYQLGCIEETKVEFDTLSFEARARARIAQWWIWAEDRSGKKSKPRLISLDDSDRIIEFTVIWQ